MAEAAPTIDLPRDARPPTGVRAAVERFVRRWLDGQGPRIETALAAGSDDERPALLHALLEAEASLRRERGEAPRIEDYLARFPGREEIVRHALDGGDLALDPGTIGVTACEANDASPGPSVPGYEILGELGRGDMGVVYKARQVGLGRTVALRMVLAGAHAGADELARFASEAEAVARLQDHGVVQVYEVGRTGGCTFFSLEYVDGGTLTDFLGGKPLPARHAAGLATSLAEAVGHAHRRGIVHRALKPANILMTAEGEPKVARLRPGEARRRRPHPLQGRHGHPRLHGTQADRWRLGRCRAPWPTYTPWAPSSIRCCSADLHTAGGTSPRR